MRKIVFLLLTISLMLTSCQNQEKQPAIDENYYDFFRENEFTEVSNITLWGGSDGFSVMWGNKCTDYDIYFKESIVGIQGGAFKNKTMRSVILPESIRWISSEAFLDCRVLTYVLLPKEIESIGKNAFAGCTNIQHVYFTGDEWDFRMIDISEGNECLTDATVYYNYVYPEIKEVSK